METRKLVLDFSICMWLVLAGAAESSAQVRVRARDLGVPFDGTPGPFNAITDVAGVEVGQVTLISGDGKLVVGKGPVRTGVTTILPRGRASSDPVFAGWFALNGNGEMTGTTWVEESGFLEGPVSITNTHSVGVVRDAVIDWMVRRPTGQPWALPVVAETYDGLLNDVNGFHVKAEHTIRALDGAVSGPVAEGAVGGGTGMVCFGFKGGIGTSSRKLIAQAGGYTVGVLVQCNAGRRSELRIAGAPVGREITDLTPCQSMPGTATGFARSMRACDATVSAVSDERREGAGSIIVVVATDAPLLAHQLRRLAVRAALGVGVAGGKGENSSGDILIAFSTANPHAAQDSGRVHLEMVPNDLINPLFYATVQATEEAIANAMVGAQTMTGANGVRVYGIPHDRLRAALKKYNRLSESIPR
ncbi:MAG TPA: P1 family peptidase [Gemmatimonadaceae bacterium]|nr:P1 family peptidase [Gemmatimonadaceae bacterium]